MDEIRTNTIFVGRYQVQRELGRGGMGAVYLAFDLQHRKSVAIKVARLAGPEARAQFRREALYLQKLTHHNLPRVLDVFSDTQRDFLVMEYIPGEDMETLVRQQGPQPEWLVLRWADELLGVLDYLHTQSPPIIHRDVKPGNLKLRQNDTLVLVDFGIAKEYIPEGDTFVGATAVTPGFSPPEQYADSPTDARTDVYSAGATLYYLLAGCAPAAAPERAAGLATVAPVSKLAPKTTQATDMLVAKALHLASDERWANAAEMRRAAEVASRKLASAAPPPIVTEPRDLPVAAGRPGVTPKPGKRPLGLAGVAALLGVALLAVAALLWIFGGRTPGAAPSAQTVTAPASTAATATPSPQNGFATATTAPVATLPVAPPPIPDPNQSVAVDTSTPIPTRTPTASANTPTQPTQTPTLPARQTAPNAVTPTATPTVMPTVMPTAAATVVVTLLEPNDGETRDGEVTFRWSAGGGSLTAGQALEVILYAAGQDPMRDGFGIAAPTTGDSVRVNLAGLDADSNVPLEPGQYWWAVRLIDQATGRPVSMVSDGRRMIYQRPSQPQPAAQPTDTPVAAPTDPPAPPPVSRSFLGAAEPDDLSGASQGGALGAGLFFALFGLTLWRQRRQN
jgi:serine/threonine protein kinase